MYRRTLLLSSAASLLLEAPAMAVRRSPPPNAALPELDATLLVPHLDEASRAHLNTLAAAYLQG